MRLLFILPVIFFTVNISAQPYFCQTSEKQNEWFAKHPELKNAFEQLQEKAEKEDQLFFAQGNQQRIASTTIYTVPVVFHILHLGGAENISDAQVLDAMNILNRDFQKLNADTAVVVTPLKQIIGDVKFQFVLATKDPNGFCTNGIQHFWDVNTDWQGSFTNYAYTWNPTKYLNIYVVRSIGSGAAGYTFLPGSGIPSAMDAIVILCGYVGSIGIGSVPLSRALTHEVGHWFNLLHTWGGTNQPGVACGNDGVSDTPITKGYTTCALFNANNCNPAIVENVQNYMDYSYCSTMFTAGQANRMQNAGNSSVSGRNNLSASSNLINTGIINPLSNCAPKLTMSSPSSTVCSGRNIFISTYTSNASPTSYLWSVNNGGVITSSNSAGANVMFTNLGSATVTCLVSNTFGSDSKTIVLNVVNGFPQIINTNSESFENIAIPPFWTVYSPSSSTIKWELNMEGAASGFSSMFIKGEDAPANTVSILETPSYDFKNNPTAAFTFKYAYARSKPSNKDIFKVQASKDCGSNWKDIFAPPNSFLALNSAGTTSATLYPEPGDWVLYDVINDSPYFTQFVNEDNVRFRFYFKEDENGLGFGNRIYLDDINFSTSVGINEITKSIAFNVFPNPSESAFTIDFTLSSLAKIKYSVSSITGAVLIEQPENSYDEGRHEIVVNQNKILTKGIYFLNFEMNGINMCKKLLVN
jgi:PKD repeat protein